MGRVAFVSISEGFTQRVWYVHVVSTKNQRARTKVERTFVRRYQLRRLHAWQEEEFSIAR